MRGGKKIQHSSAPKFTAKKNGIWVVFALTNKPVDVQQYDSRTAIDYSVVCYLQ